METKTASVWRSSLIAGIFTGIALILFEMIRHATDQLYNQKIGFISILIIAAGVILAAGALFNTFITGLLAGLITAAFVKKKPEEPFSEFE